MTTFRYAQGFHLLTVEKLKWNISYLLDFDIKIAIRFLCNKIGLLFRRYGENYSCIVIFRVGMFLMIVSLFPCYVTFWMQFVKIMPVYAKQKWVLFTCPDFYLFSPTSKRMLHYLFWLSWSLWSTHIYEIPSKNSVHRALFVVIKSSIISVHKIKSLILICFCSKHSSFFLCFAIKALCLLHFCIQLILYSA